MVVPEGRADSPFQRVASKVDRHARLLRAWPLPGGVSAQVTALEIGLPDGRAERLVVRQYGATELQGNPDVAQHEFRLLEAVRGAGVPAPRPHLADRSGQVLPGPYLVTSMVEGEPVLDPPGGVPGLTRLARQLAAVLARIHRVPLDGLPVLRDQQQVFGSRLAECPDRLDDALSEGSIRAALARAWPPSRQNEPVLLHGDFWPGNTLWRDGRLAAVIDWEDAGSGDPLADLANGRLEIAMFFGQDAMDEFTGHYRSLMGWLDYANLPCWDLQAALRPAGKMSSWGLGADVLRRLRGGHRAFVAQALARLPG